MIVAATTRAKRRFDLQHAIDHVQRILDQPVAGLADAIAHQLQKSGVDDVLGRKDGTLAGWPILDRHEGPVRIFLASGIADVDRQNADVVPRDARHQGAWVVTVHRSTWLSRKSAYSCRNCAVPASPRSLANSAAHVNAAMFAASVDGE